MRILKWFLYLLPFLILGLFAHYTLPQRDVVRITGTEIIRSDFTGWNRIFYASADGGNAETPTRDLRLINAVYPNGKVIVFRNEDTGWFKWPPYFKTNSSDVAAESENFKSNAEPYQWVSIKHYGWRFTPLSIYPNAISLYPVETPDTRFIPWFNIIFGIILALFLLGFYRVIQRFRRKRIDPMLDDMGDTWDGVSASTATLGDRFRGWFKSFGGR